jgi:cyclopropane-fatty-acyl-phospholipid synthase
MFWQRTFDTVVSHLGRNPIPARIRLWNGAEARLGPDPSVTITLPTRTALLHMLKPSLDRLGRDYVEGTIEVDGRARDIIDVASKLAASANGASRAPRRVWRHSRKADADAIAYHYDVSNDFYARWLDRHMVYSCAYFRTPGDSLEDAQLQKIDHILTKLRVQPGDRLLDIGCGWGALVMRAAEKFGAQALGITLSRNQLELAQERIAAAGLGAKCEVRLEDYRDVAGRFDRVCSVGMFEHVGLENLRGYFGRIATLLADNGVAMNHGITSTDPDSAQVPWGGGEFIDRYVFPKGELPHISLALREMCAAGLEPVDVENLRRHYALTLGQWTERFEAAGPQLREMVGEKRFRIWRIYLAGCAHAFEQGWISLYQVLATKAGAAPLPLTRDYMYRG